MSIDYNSLTIKILKIDDTETQDPQKLFRRHTDTRFSTIFPGGKFAVFSTRLPRNVKQVIPYHLWKKIKVYSNHKLVWEGTITDLTETRQGNIFYTEVSAVGPWGRIMEHLAKEKMWADNRLTGEVWKWVTTATGAEKGNADQFNRLRLTPKAEAWTSGENLASAYTMPTGETIKRVTLDYDMQEAAQAWELRLRDTVGAADIWSVTASGTGSRDDTLGTPRQLLALQLLARANQTPTSDGTYYGEVSNVMVYSETGNINIYEIAKDIIALLTGYVSADTWLCDSALTYSLVPFITNGLEYYASILRRAAAFGNGSAGSIGFGLDSSARSSDGKPILFVQSYPSLTGTPDYKLSLSESPGASIRRDYDAVRNYISVEYIDELGRKPVLTPNDDASLTDSDSVTAYGRRYRNLKLGQVSSTMAIEAGQRYLAQYKDPQFAVLGPLRAVGKIQGGAGGYVPASFVQAGKVLEIPDYLNPDTGKPIQMVVTATEYEHDTQTVSLTVGVPDDLSVFLAQNT